MENSETEVINLLKTVWIAGFRASEEDWNGDYPFGQGGSKEDKEDLNATLENYIENSELLRRRVAEAMIRMVETELR